MFTSSTLLHFEGRLTYSGYDQFNRVGNMTFFSTASVCAVYADVKSNSQPNDIIIDVIRCGNITLPTRAPYLNMTLDVYEIT